MFSIERLSLAHLRQDRGARRLAAITLTSLIGLLAAAGASARVGAPTIYPGDFSPAVGCVQGALNNYAGRNLVEDQHFGPATKAAVQDLQRLFKLDTDGIVGPLTGDAINTVVVFNATPEEINFWNYTCLQVIPTTRGLGTP